MLTKNHRIPDDISSTFESITNYYERLVFRRLSAFSDELTDEELADAACIALNHLPTWYIRHSVDAQYFLDDEKVAEMNQKANRVVEDSVTQVKQLSK